MIDAWTNPIEIEDDSAWEKAQKSATEDDDENWDLNDEQEARKAIWEAKRIKKEAEELNGQKRTDSIADRIEDELDAVERLEKDDLRKIEELIKLRQGELKKAENDQKGR